MLNYVQHDAVEAHCRINVWTESQLNGQNTQQGKNSGRFNLEGLQFPCLTKAFEVKIIPPFLPFLLLILLIYFTSVHVIDHVYSSIFNSYDT